jgi:predicted RNA binding protein YcfA (HicA-like mRNA interferase family)
MKLKPLPSKKVILILEKLGFKKIRQRGSHLFFRHADGRTTIVPIHKGEDIGRGLLQEIIKDTKLTKEKFLKYLSRLRR